MFGSWAGSVARLGRSVRQEGLVVLVACAATLLVLVWLCCQLFQLEVTAGQELQQTASHRCHCHQPIDLVVTWVNGSDPAFQVMQQLID